MVAVVVAVVVHTCPQRASHAPLRRERRAFPRHHGDRGSGGGSGPRPRLPPAREGERQAVKKSGGFVSWFR